MKQKRSYMNVTPPPVIRNKLPAPSIHKTLRKLYLTLFLRGHSSRGLAQKGIPTSIAQKLGLVLLLYAALGLSAFGLISNETFVLSAYLHAITFMCIGMFLVSCSGETLFNKEEGEILLHRPIESKTILWAKIVVLIQVSLYLSVAINLVGLFVGTQTSDGSWLFPLAHLVSTVEEALFSAGCIVLVYQLCLRWFGRERLENMMTMMQVLATVGFIVGSQIIPRVLINNAMFNHAKVARPWWLDLLPPGWFAGLDDALAGSHVGSSWVLAGIGLGVTSLVLWLAFDKLAKSYEAGWQTLNESTAPKVKEGRQVRFFTNLAQKAPVSWWLKGSVERVAFVLTAAYLIRDRETKLRVYPSIASVFMMPIVMAISNPERHYPGPAGAHISHVVDPIMSTMGLAFAGAFLGYMPMSALNFLAYSQQWKASEVFRMAPMRGPWAIQRGAQVATVVLLVLPMLIVLIGLAFALHQVAYLPLVLPGLLLVPAYALVPALLQGSVILSQPSEEAKAASRGCALVGVMFVAMGFAGVAMLAWQLEWFTFVLSVEIVLVLAFCFIANGRLKVKPWRVEE